MKVTIKNIEEFTKKNGDPIEGDRWKLWKIIGERGQYKMFGSRSDPGLAGKTFDFDVQEEEDDWGWTIITNPTIAEEDGEGMVMDEIEALNDRLDKMGKYLKEMRENQDLILTELNEQKGERKVNKESQRKGWQKIKNSKGL